ncbi:ferritin [Corynebacterium kroppenstedtii]|jgi:ferritin|uniref:Ferritin n=1 Tax=Corynebacterium kroppenstedtii TaxID=161879 RepID=A0A2W5SVP5_9CORY|nr:ferritin [Corynebacterium kroppenstedtii]MDU7287205.1 ferritin [Corynebacterium kroppenstedtii]PZR03616.1 MAG: ferritin [Corynebacterium kroppenstedtii]
MAISDTIQKALNDQFTAELQAALVYKQLGLELDRLSLVGMRDWMRAQVDEEFGHAHAFSDHILARGGQVTISTLSIPELNIQSAKDAFQAALEHEKKVSGLIRDLAKTADTEGDLDSRQLIDRFLTEQIEEEDTVNEILDRLELVGDDGAGILRLDAELGQR